MKPPAGLLAVFATACLVATGCGIAAGKAEAEAVVTRHFQAISTNGFDAALGDYGKPFFQKTTTNEWAKVLTAVNKKLGDYQSHSVTGWRMFRKAGTSGAGTTVSLQCKVKYAKHEATESFTLFKGVGEADYKILGHSINSMALLTE